MAERANGNGAKSARQGGRRRWWRWAAAAGGVLVLALVVLVFLLPTLASTGPGTRFLLGILNGQISGSATAEDVRLTWASGQSAHGVRLWDPQGELVFHSERVEAPGLRLLPVAMGRYHLGQVEVSDWHLALRQQPGQPTNLAQAVSPREEWPEPDEPMQFGEDFSARIEARAGRVTYEGPDIETVELTNLHAMLDLSDPRRIAMEARGEIRQADEVGNIDARLRLDDAFDARGRAQFARAHVVEGHADVTNLPLMPIDRMLEQGGQLVALLGPRLNGQLRAEGPMTGLEATLAAQSEHLDVDMGLRGTAEALSARPNSRLSLHVTPEAASLMGVTLREAVLLEVVVSELMLPRDGDAFLWDRMAVQLRGEASDAVLEQWDGGLLSLHDVRLGLSSASVGELLEGWFEAEAQVGEVREPVEARASVANAMREDLPMQAQANLTAFPLALADALAGMDGGLVVTFGETLDARLSAEREPADGAMRFAGSVASPRLEGNITGGMDGEGTMNLQVQPMTWELTPAAQAFWMANEDATGLRLIDPMRLDMTLNMTLGMLDEAAELEGMAGLLGRLDPARTRISADARSAAGRFRDTATGRVLTVQDVELRVTGDDLAEVLELLIQMQVPIEGGGVGGVGGVGGGAPGGGQAGAAAGRVFSRTQVRQLVGTDGRLSLDGVLVESETQLDRVPSVLIDAVGWQDGDLAAVLGPSTSADMSLIYEVDRGGEATVNLYADNARGRIAATMDPQWILGLREDPTLELDVTPEMTVALLQPIFPLLSSITGAQAPLVLTVSREGFRLPLADFDWREVSLNARLSEADVVLSSQPPLGPLLFSALRPVLGSPPFQAKLGSVGLEMARGVLSYEGLSLSFTGVSMGVGGDVDFGDDGRLNLNLLLAGDRVTRLVPGGIVLPIGGTVDEPAFDQQRLVQALAQAGVRRGVEELLGNNRVPGPLDIIFGRPGENGTAEEGEPAPEQDEANEREGEPAPRDPLGELLERLRGR